jgi:PIN domain nuclease of toxin-antitoxin system
VRLLLDTHLLLWATASSKRLSLEARDLIEDEGNEVHFSAASMWEIAIKSALGRRDFRVDIGAMAAALPAMGFAELPVTSGHAVAVTRLPAIHRDPFDRLLIAQSITEPLTLVTNDAALARYSDAIRIV